MIQWSAFSTSVRKLPKAGDRALGQIRRDDV